MDAVELLEKAEVGAHLIQGGHGAGEDYRGGTAALAGQHRHGADGLEHQIHRSGGQISGRGILRQVAEVCGSHVGIQGGSHGFGDVPDGEIHLVEVSAGGQFLDLAEALHPYQLVAQSAQGAAADAAAALFAGGASAANVPSFTLTKDEFAADSRVTTMLVKSGLCKSQSDARNQVKAGAVLVADKKVDDLNATLAESDVPADGLLIQKGKKNFRRLFLA